MPRKAVAVEVPETGAQVEILLPLARRGRTGGDCTAARAGAGAKPPTRPTIPRITRLMALAIKFQDMVDRGEVADYADLARLGYVTRARLTQIMNLLLLAPDVQEAILIVDRVATASLNEHQLRAVARIFDWGEQRRAFAEMTAGTARGC